MFSPSFSYWVIFLTCVLPVYTYTYTYIRYRFNSCRCPCFCSVCIFYLKMMFYSLEVTVPSILLCFPYVMLRFARFSGYRSTSFFSRRVRNLQISNTSSNIYHLHIRSKNECPRWSECGMWRSGEWKQRDVRNLGKMGIGPRPQASTNHSEWQGYAHINIFTNDLQCGSTGRWEESGWDWGLHAACFILWQFRFLKYFPISPHSIC